jgi:hypothetical protein
VGRNHHGQSREKSRAALSDAPPDRTKFLSLIKLLVRKRILTQSESAALRDPIL